ncbi:septum formation family protein [Frankia sp. Mgl5]|uniref:septum formation family protein n=1 Tax=Frankia sp. Mgl5 TaxID=2933793 RepID=UPI0020103646|nr:septum formation family protein [Frankia sp. Mgl5]MCK9930390.1 septum formation family protein [Frankia sp. Mgl5]
MPGNSAYIPKDGRPDPFADLVLDEAFIAGATRYEAPARTRAALARFGPLEDGSTPWCSSGAGRPRRAGGTSGQPLAHGRMFRPFPEFSPPPRSRARIVLALLSAVLFVTTVYGFVASAGDSPPSTTLSAGPPPAAGNDPGRDAAAESLPDLHRRDWTAGHCYTWLQRDAGSAVDDVPCAGRHLFEVVGPLDVESTYPGGEPYPSPAEWYALGEWHCEPLVTAYLGYGLDPSGRFAMNILHPGEPEWNAGERDIVCGLSLRPAPETPNEVPDLEGQVRGADQART